MKTIVALLSVFVFCMYSFAQTNPPVNPDFAKVDQAFGQTGKSQPGDVWKYTWPRTDLHVMLNGIAIEPGLALGSWAAFHKSGSQLMTMGDLVLLPTELNNVIGALQTGGIKILAVHNHLTGEVPEVVYVHFSGRGSADQLASALKSALQKSKTPMPATPAKPAAAAKPEKAFETIQNILGKQGNVSGKVLQIGVPRKGTIEEDGEEIPASMGMSISMNFQMAGLRVASTGDFVLIADEVNPVIQELHAHGILITALHTHMLHDSPHLFFMHFWGVDSPEKLTEGLKAALSKVSTKE